MARSTSDKARSTSVVARPHVAREHLAPRTSHVRVRVLTIVSPPDGATYLIDPTLRREFQTLSLKAAAPAGPVRWTIDGRVVGAADAGSRVEWPLVPGRHRIEAHDGSGRTAAATVVVR
ncbi:MAG TPA: hypothetical protein VNJ04_04135 [Gemmatimonadaceae bacterium]|nr:hypothetical protein [Gemmatimonadaceae bacterium]